jgi:hypothetical protein
MATRPTRRTGDVDEEAGTHQPVRRDRPCEQGRDGDTVGDAAPSSPTPAALPSSSSSGDFFKKKKKKKKKKSTKTDSVDESAPSSTAGQLKMKKKKKKFEDGDKRSQTGSDSQVKDTYSKQDGDFEDTGSGDLKSKPKKKATTTEGNQVAQCETSDAIPRASSDKHSETSKVADRSAKETRKKSARASKTELDDSAPIESVGTMDDMAHTIDSFSSHSGKKTPAKSHRERQREQMNQIDMDEPHLLDVPHESENPGAQRIGNIHDDESNTIFLERPDDEDGQVPGPEGATVIAWKVGDHQEVQPSIGGDNPDVEGQEAADIPEAVVQKGLGAWIQGHMMLTAILIAVCVAAIVVPLAIDSPKDPGVQVSRQLEVLQIIEEQSQESLDLANLSPHQLQALKWLANEDEWTLDFQNEDHIIVVQRYALAAIRYATAGWPNATCLPFMSKLHHCAWQVESNNACIFNSSFVEEGDDPHDTTSNTVGVGCDSNKYVTSLNLGMWNPCMVCKQEISMRQTTNLLGL